MKKYIIIASSLFFASFAMQSCLDFDDPGTELGVGSVILDTDRHVGNVDTIPYLNQPTAEGVDSAITALQNHFGQILTGQYNMRGGKEGGTPAEHAYQRQYSLGPDLYAQYFTLPHKDFMYGSHTSTYNVSAEFNNNALGAYTMAKNAFMPLLHHPLVDSIPEIKAITLLYYSVIAQEQADLSGPYTYLEDKQNSETPYEYNDVKTIYYGIVENLDTIINCLKHYPSRPEWYKGKIKQVLNTYTDTNPWEDGSTLESYVRLANSLKLRMAMHIVKVEPETAKRWAEEAVASGVIEDIFQQHGIYTSSGFAHPLIGICGWGDLCISASLESLLMSLNHPYAQYLFLKNSNDIKNARTKEITPAGTRICGIRSGTLVGDGQLYAQNERQAYSKYDTQELSKQQPPLYFVKLAEVYFLRAEGALRGWNMGGTAEDFYKLGIQKAYFEDPSREARSKYVRLLDAYMEQENPVEYVSVDPMGNGPDWQSVTKIGVKWNNADDQETKLEKIITQKYLALFPLSTEAWAELRRTGYPKLFPVLNTDDGDGSIAQGDMIRRIPWVPTSPTDIEMVENSGISALGGPDEQATRIWWDIDAPNF
ncbi:MAG: SusD/RagB family nutrient-binding outer membrane lipoprotein [Bacteroidaceae bacterium]|nr:SusD/RagB family nutrient-binding outer membrane lipoprotein [Bacteroidaceae bacterium]